MRHLASRLKRPFGRGKDQSQNLGETSTPLHTQSPQVDAAGSPDTVPASAGTGNDTPLNPDEAASVLALAPQVQAVTLAPPAAAASRSRSVSSARASTAETDHVADQLWDEAYDKVKSANAKLVTSYELILSDALQHESGQYTHGHNVVEQSDPQQRRTQMGRIAKHMLDKNQKAMEREARAQSAMNIAYAFKEVIEVGMKAVPSAALAWAAVCAALGMINATLEEIGAVQEGLEHVIKRMDWYTSLANHLFNNSRQLDTRSSQLLDSLRKLVLDMYQTLLDFLMRAICDTDKNYGHRALGNAVRWSGWVKSLQNLEKVEKFTENKIDQFNQRYAGSNLAALATHQISKDYRDLMGMLRVPGMDHEMKDLRTRKDDLLEDSYRWILNNDTFGQFIKWERSTNENESHQDGKRQVLWLRGDPGKGKTMLLVGVIKELKAALETRADAPNAAFFFCQATDFRLNTGISVLRGLIWMLLKQDERLLDHLDELRQYGPDVFGHRTAFRVLRDILEKVFQDPRFTPTYLVIDALDECRGDESSPGDLLEFINDSSRAYPGMIKWLVSSRNEPDIQDQLEQHRETSVSLEINDKSVGEAVNAFIDFKMEGLAIAWYNKHKGQGEATRKKIEEIKEDMARDMKSKAEGTFLWVALVFKQIGSRSAQDALKQVRNQVSGLRNIYASMMQRVLGTEDMSQKCRDVLLALVNTYRPPSVLELSVLAGLDDLDYHEDIVRSCGLLTISHEGETVHFVHQSAKDFLTLDLSDESNHNWKGILDRIFKNGHQDGHRMMAQNSLGALENELETNMYHLSSHTISLEMAIVSKPDPDPLQRLGYASLYWADHLTIATTSRSIQASIPVRLLSDDSQVLQFLRHKFLNWLESLSLLGDISQGVASISRLAAQVSASNGEIIGPALAAFLQDAYRFIFAYRSAIENFPLQIYTSLIFFCPSESFIKSHFQSDVRSWVSILGHGLMNQWDSCLHVLEGHLDEVQAMALSYDGNLLIATADRQGVIKVWERRTGRCVATTKVVAQESIDESALAFSRDGKSLAVGQDFRVMILGLHTTEVLSSFSTVTGAHLIRFSGDDSNLLITDGWTIDIRTPKGEQKGEIEVFGCYTLSEDASLFLTCEDFESTVVVLWNTHLQTINSQWDTGNRVTALAISHDSQLVASWGSGSINVWSRKETALIHTVTVDRASMLSRLSISRDGRHVAWESREDEQAFLTFSDVTNGRAVDCVAIHGNYHAKSHVTDDGRQLIASHGLSTVAIWELELNKTREEIYEARTSPSDLLYSVLLGSQQYIVSLVSSGGFGGYLGSHTARLWNIQTGQINAAFVSAVIPKVRSASNAISFVSEDGIYLLGTKTPESSGERCVTKGRFQNYCFSRDGSLLATISSTDEKRTVAVWNVSDGELKFTDSVLVNRRTAASGYLCFTGGDKHLLCVINGKGLLMWDMDGQRTYEEEVRGWFVITLSPDGNTFVAAFEHNERLEFRDIPSGNLKTAIDCPCRKYHRCVTCSPDMGLIALSSSDDTVRIFSTETGQCLQLLYTPGASLTDLRLNLESSPALLHTRLGSIVLDLGIRKEGRQEATFQGLSVSPDLSWVTWKNKRLLYLPTDYQPLMIANEPNVLVSDTQLTVSIGCRSGRVFMLRFDPTKFPEYAL